MNELVLRPHQVHVEGQLRDQLRAGVSRIVLVAPTAFGKTETAMFLIKLALQKGSRVWFLVDRVTLVKQTSDRFRAYGIDHGVIQGANAINDRYAPEKAVQIISIQTFERRDLGEPADLIFYDECHSQYAKTVARLEKYKKSKIIGMTATPFAPGMAQFWGGLVNGATVNRLLAEGFLTPLKIKACVSPDMKGAKRKPGGEYADDDAGQRGITIIGDVVQTWIQQTQKYFGGPVKTIVFSPSVKHGEEICRQFAFAGYNFQQISYLDRGEDDRDDKIDEFRKPDSAIHGLVSCAVLTKGFDVSDVKCGISTAYNLRLRAGATDLAFAALKEIGYDVYLPRRRLDRFNRRLNVTAEWSEPLMPGYLFLVHPRPGQQADDWTEVRAIDGVLGPLGGIDGPLRIPARVVESILTAEFESVYDETKAAKKYRGETSRSAMEKRFARGKTFRVKDGPFASFMAKADSLTHQDRVKMLIDIFGQMVPVEMDPEQLEEVAPKSDKAA